MNTYLWHVSYTALGSEGLLAEGGTSRRTTIEALTASAGGTIESWYYALGDDDLYVIAHLPGDVEATAVSLRVAASGAARIRTTTLLTADQIDAAAKVTLDYRAPGA
jgi:uncharacterized protein with GYD domain